MTAAEHLGPQFADQVEYTPSSFSHVDFLNGRNGPITSKYRMINPRTGFEIAQHRVEATHPEHGVVGHAKWDDQGNITVEVLDPYRRHGIGMRLVDEAVKHDPENALRGLTPVSHAGHALADKVSKKYGVTY